MIFVEMIANYQIKWCNRRVSLRSGMFTRYTNITQEEFVLIAAFFFAIAFSITPMFSDVSMGSFSVFRFIFGFLGFMICEYSLPLLLEKARGIKPIKNSEYKLSDKAWFIITAALSFIISLFYFIVYYPGTDSYDTGQVVNFGIGVADQHPLLYCAFVSLIKAPIISLGGNETPVVAAMTLIQMLFASLVTAHAITYLKKQNIKKPFLIIITLLYLLPPIIAIYNVSPLKDVMFAYVIVEWVIFLHECSKDPENRFGSVPSYIRGAILIILSLLRNNGIYAVLLTLIITAIIFRKHYKKILPYILMLVVIFGIYKTTEKALGITHIFKETVGLPLQQISAVICSEDPNISENEKEFINKVIDLNYVRESYSPYNSDKIKWGDSPIDDDFLQSHKSEFIKTWISLLFKNPITCLKAHLYNTYGFWAVKPIDTADENSHAYVYNTSYLEGMWGIFIKDSHFHSRPLPVSVQFYLLGFLNELEKYAHIAGTLFWIFVLLFAVVLKRSGIASTSCTIPVFAVWLTVILGAPHAFMYRYMFCLVLCIPVILGIVIIEFCTSNS